MTPPSNLNDLSAPMPDDASVRSTPTAGHVPNRWALGVIRHAKPILVVAASRAIAGRNRSRTDPVGGRFTRKDVAGFVSAALARFEVLAPDLPHEPTVGSRQNVMLAALTLSLMEVLEQAGVDRQYAIELTGDTCWRFYRHWGRITMSATRFISRDSTCRLRLNVNAFLAYPFGRPGYRFDDVPEEDGRSLNMLRCPVADYLGQRSAADLCAGSWCNLDYALAEMWGARLERSSTLVAGARHCDFRFITLRRSVADTSDTNGSDVTTRPVVLRTTPRRVHEVSPDDPTQYLRTVNWEVEKMQKISQPKGMPNESRNGSAISVDTRRQTRSKP